MQEIVITKPYRFVPPTRGRIWPRVLLYFLDNYMKKHYGICSREWRGAENLRQSLDAGHGIMVVGNHGRPCDPVACGWLTVATHHPFYCMASWHLFMGQKFQRFLIRRCGAFSVYREGVDHASLNFAVKSLTLPDRPVVIFPEGSVTRSTNRLRPFLDGVSVIPRIAARRRAKARPPGKVVIHPIALKYFFQGDVEATLQPVLNNLERHFGWEPRPQTSLLDRIRNVGSAMLGERENEYLGATQSNDGDSNFHGRLTTLLAGILDPLEQQWNITANHQEGTYSRVQRIRSRILPALVESELSEEEQSSHWRQLKDCYVAQQLGCYPKDYLNENPTPERIIETVERLEEDLTDKTTIHRPWHLVMQVGTAIDVKPHRQRDGGPDELLSAITTSMGRMLEQIGETPPY